jgi:phosphoribosyl-AMP cyclohydrolase
MTLTKQELESGSEFAPRFNSDGLIAAIVADAGNGDVLMFAYMNEEALRLTIETGEAHFWSRSRNRLWRKGETSGNVLTVREIRIDCDQDCILLIADIAGDAAACHTGSRSCFYRRIEIGKEQMAGLAFIDR